MSTLPWLLGGGAFAAYLGSRFMTESSSAARTASSTPTGTANPPPRAGIPAPPTTKSPDRTPPTIQLTLPGQWVVPVARWRDRAPVISSGIGTPRTGGPHRGVDLMFKRRPEDPFKPGTPNGAARHVMPDNVVALAAGDGVVWSAGPTPRGFAVVIDHSPVKLATYYAHLERLFVTPTDRATAQQRVKAGQPIGIVGFDPLDGAKLRHLHFETWQGGAKDAIDPQPLLAQWKTIADPRETLVARNGGLAYRPVGATGDAYPDWVRDLRGKSGVYVIREVHTDGDTEIVYVGQSSANKLYETLTRHFQAWRRWKSFWRDQYAEGHDPGLTYARERVEVAARVTSPSAALDEESRLIRRLKPRDNLIGQPADDEVPF